VGSATGPDQLGSSRTDHGQGAAGKIVPRSLVPRALTRRQNRLTGAAC